MKSSCIAWLAVALLLAALSGARASDFPGSVPVILGNDSVRQDLGLSKSQSLQLDKIRADYKAAARTLTARHPESATEKQAANTALAQLNSRYNAKALQVLSPAQAKRLDQIGHQTLGGWMLLVPRIQKELQLTEKQISAITSLRQDGDDFVSRINKEFEAGEIGLQDRLKTLREWRMKESQKYLRVLTPAQKKSLDASQGRDFKPA